MTYSYKTNGTCSREIRFEVRDGIVSNIEFVGGCNGNLKGIAALCEGMKASDVIEKLRGIRCGFKSTSCPDQLASALAKSVLKDGD
ncbi:MAG: TIGR03905 family TSCPD domain-containing protein [Clostridia bacterium]|nr:TIGR03905 family TSCPD domain-containing protein [Clostridia bacterium]